MVFVMVVVYKVERGVVVVGLLIIGYCIGLVVVGVVDCSGICVILVGVVMVVGVGGLVFMVGVGEVQVVVVVTLVVVVLREE